LPGKLLKSNSEVAFEHGTSQHFQDGSFRVHIPVFCTNSTLGVYLLLSLSLQTFWSKKETEMEIESWNHRIIKVGKDL